MLPYHQTRAILFYTFNIFSWKFSVPLKKCLTTTPLATTIPPSNGSINSCLKDKNTNSLFFNLTNKHEIINIVEQSKSIVQIVQPLVHNLTYLYIMEYFLNNWKSPKVCQFSKKERNVTLLIIDQNRFTSNLKKYRKNNCCSINKLSR